ncbi:MAG TPA: HIT domain-containing protein, partial [Candidatus Binatia bacterium]|nr:HIT domain-containing protein [Candidatus Binatia bacterium]
MADYEPDCLFCRIAAGEIPAERVYEDDDVVVFRDINPKAPTHVLAIPRRHIASAANLTDADGELLASLFAALRHVAEEAGLRGYRIITNVGAESG